MLQILKDYETMSDQQINFQIFLTIGHRIDEDTWKEMHDILGIHTLEEMESFLGIPKSLDEYKTQMLGSYRILYIID